MNAARAGSVTIDRLAREMEAPLTDVGEDSIVDTGGKQHPDTGGGRRKKIDPRVPRSTCIVSLV